MMPIIGEEIDYYEFEVERAWNQYHSYCHSIKSQLSLSTEREERYRKALGEITKLNTEGVTKASIIARAALNEGKEVK